MPRLGPQRRPEFERTVISAEDLPGYGARRVRYTLACGHKEIRLLSQSKNPQKVTCSECIRIAEAGGS